MMSPKLAGATTIPKGSYLGSGEAMLFIRTNDRHICDKVAYIYEDSPAGEFLSDEHHMSMKVTMPSWQAGIPSLKIYYDLMESE